MDETRGGHFEPVRQQRAGDELARLRHGNPGHRRRLIRSRDHVRSRPGTSTRQSQPDTDSRRSAWCECAALPSCSLVQLYQLTAHQVQSFLAIGAIRKVYITWKLAAISSPSATAARSSRTATIRASLVAAIAASR